MVKYKIYSLGCKVSQSEADQIRAVLEGAGLKDAASDRPDLCIVNTCAVTARAASKSRRLIRALAGRYPAAEILVLGCYATFADDSIRSLPQVKLIFDHRKGDIIRAVEEYVFSNILAGRNVSYAYKGDDHRKEEYSSRCKVDNKDSHLAGFNADRTGHLGPFSGQVMGIRPRPDRTRAFLKVQDGCNAGCTYCIIPKLRPNLYSVSIDKVVELAKELIDQGYKEIVLCGIFLGAYGRSTAKKTRQGQPEYLVELLSRLVGLSGLGRIRLSSLEPLDLSSSLLDLIAEQEKLARHLHLPLQSGSDRILRLMGRQYRRDEYLLAIENARSKVPDIAITTDIIVGFADEGEEDFRETVEVVEKTGFLKMHIFPFSPRPGTAAYKWAKTLDIASINRRMQILLELDKILRKRYISRFSGKLVDVLVETKKKTASFSGEDPLYWYEGRASQYFKVGFSSSREDLCNRFVRVLIDQVKDDIALGSFIEAVEK